MDIDSNRLLLELDKRRREINRNIINPAIPEISLEDLNQLLSMVAEVRRDYLCSLLDLTKNNKGKAPASEGVHVLRQQREMYDELVAAVNALETAIQRGYLDVRPARK